jgi:hypothetical protein
VTWLRLEVGTSGIQVGSITTSAKLLSTICPKFIIYMTVKLKHLWNLKTSSNAFDLSNTYFH